ncbi:hypothetical protein [Rhizobium gallicum]|uniref:hypothetical protein n=1 Tax=Rhizobium gallicum TaxID=56730 RepID=UPI001EF85527|nr:hypothetical protein [Rhizobium gallicum]ULJ74587.1 hypothetical protein L2W42_21345 [Rhizobium gallicum]
MDTDKRLLLSPEDRVRLESWGGGTEHAAEAGLGADRVDVGGCVESGAIVRTLGKTKKTTYRWRDQYLEQGVDGLARDANPAWP